MLLIQTSPSICWRLVGRRLVVSDTRTDLLADGGGIRGLSELLILKEIMLRIQAELQKQQPGADIPVPRPCEYFHLLGGTSTGG